MINFGHERQAEVIGLEVRRRGRIRAFATVWADCAGRAKRSSADRDQYQTAEKTRKQAGFRQPVVSTFAQPSRF